MKQYIMFIVLFLLVGCVKHKEDRDLPNYVVVLAGQSNMAGNAIGLGPSLNNKVWSLGLDRRLKVAQEPLNNPINVVDTALTGSCVGVGPGSYFANFLSQKMSCNKVVLVPCAKGSTSMSYWEDGGPLYNLMVERATYTLSCLPRAQVLCVLFWQGESDTFDQFSAEDWGRKFQSFVSGVRRDLGDVPIVFSQIHFKDGDVNREIVRYQQALINLPNVYMINVDDLPANGDHLFENGYIIAAKRFFKTLYYQKIMYEKSGNRTYLFGGD